MKVILWTIIIVLTATISKAGEVADEQHELYGIIPDFFIDTSGFEIMGENRLALLGADRTATPIPLFPLFDKGLFSNTFIGVTVPANYLRNSDRNKIVEQIKNIKFEDGTKLSPLFYKGNLYGIRSDYDIEYGERTIIGLHFNFGGKTVRFGSDLVIGGSLNLGGTTTHIGERSGINVLSGYQKLLNIPNEIINIEDQKSFYNKVQKFAPYIMHYLNKNAEGLHVPNKDNRATWLGNPNPKLEPKIFQLNAPISDDSWSEEFKTLMATLRDMNNLDKEIKWRNEVAEAVKYQFVLASDEAHRFLQDICDHISAAYQVPKEIYPRCRIAGTLAPNAWAYPGGDIFVSAGLIGILSDLDSLRLVLGHEIGHVIGRHTTRAMPGRTAFMYAANGASLVAQVGLSSFALSGGKGMLGDVNWLTWLPQATALGVGLGYVANIGMEVLFWGPYAALMAHSRSLEWQADRLGHETALATGANPDKLSEGWGEFSDFIKKYLDPYGKRQRSLTASHPEPQTRGEEIQKRQLLLAQKFDSYKVNRLSESYYAEYRELHNQFHPNVQYWGENALKKLKSGDERASNFAMYSLMSPAGKCIIHALQGQGITQ